MSDITITAEGTRNKRPGHPRVRWVLLAPTALDNEDITATLCWPEYYRRPRVRRTNTRVLVTQDI